MKMSGRSRLIFSMMVLIVLIPWCGAVEPIWEVKSGQNSDIRISDDGSVIVVGGDHITVLSRSGDIVWSGWSGSNNDLSGNGKYLVTVQGVYKRLIDTMSGVVLWEKERTGGIVDAVISKNGAMIVSAEDGGIVRFCNNAGIGLGTNLDNDEMPTKIRQLAISNDGEQTIAVAESGLYSYNKTGNLTWWHERGGQKVAMSDDNTILATVRGNTVSVFHVSGHETWHDNLFHGDGISFGFSGDGSTIVIGSNDNNIYVIDGNGRPLWNKNTGMWVNSVAVSEDGQKIASGSMNRNINLFDRAGNVIWTYAADGSVNSVAITRDGTFLVAATDSSIYGFSTIKPLLDSQTPTPLPTETETKPGTAVQTPQSTQTTPASTSTMPVPTQKAPIPEFILFSGILIAFFLKKMK